MTDPVPPCQAVPTPAATTVERLRALVGATDDRILKTLIVMVDRVPCAAVLAGDRQADLAAVARAVGGKKCRMADPDTVLRVTGAPVGWAGPVGLADPAVAIVVDVGLDTGGYWAGGNAVDVHFRDVVVGRDFVPRVTAPIVR